MKIVYFSHSLQSCWNHGNAHFLRGVLQSLRDAGHDAQAWEPAHSWSLANLLQDHGDAGLDAFRTAYPNLPALTYDTTAEAEAAAQDAALVIMHEWNDPDLVAAIGRMRQRGARFTLLFHDTHHRAASDPAAIRQFDLSGYDGVLAFGETLAAIYRRWGWQGRVWVWHEAADITRFQPPATESIRDGLVWIGNWGDGERTAELEHFLLRPAKDAGLALRIHGVRYPAEAHALLARYGATYAGWLPNVRAPAVFARHLATVHVPRRHYVQTLPGIPTIRVFEALACGIPLVCAPWDDCEGLFDPGRDYLLAADEAAMTAHLRALRHDADLRASLVAHGLATIRARHTCGHRAAELMAITHGLRGSTILPDQAA